MPRDAVDVMIVHMQCQLDTACVQSGQPLQAFEAIIDLVLIQQGVIAFRQECVRHLSDHSCCQRDQAAGWIDAESNGGFLGARNSRSMRAVQGMFRRRMKASLRRISRMICSLVRIASPSS